MADDQPRVHHKVLVKGDGERYPRKGNFVRVHYTGTLASGEEFDSTHERGRPFQFQVGEGQVIPGWDEGVSKMSLGETALVTMPPELAYGAKGFPGLVPPNETISFTVELLTITEF